MSDPRLGRRTQEELGEVVARVAAADADAPPLAVDSYDHAGPIRACLAFSPSGKQLVGAAINLAWLTRSGELTGRLHLWEAAAE